MATAQTVLLLAVYILLITEFILATQDFYHILGVPRDATERQIKKAFHRLAMKYHPDKNKSPDAESKFRDIAEAYETLSDDKRRREYDQPGGQGPFPGRGANHGRAQGGPSANFHQYFQSFNFDDLFKDFDQFGQPHHNHNHHQHHHHHHHHQHHQHSDPHSHAYAHSQAYAHAQAHHKRHFDHHKEAADAHKRQFQQGAFGAGGGGGGAGVFDNMFEDLEKMFSFNGQGSRSGDRFQGAAGKHCRTVTQRRGNMVSTFTDCTS